MARIYAPRAIFPSDFQKTSRNNVQMASKHRRERASFVRCYNQRKKKVDGLREFQASRFFNEDGAVVLVGRDGARRFAFNSESMQMDAAPDWAPRH